jgi:hypothetical protein
VVCGLYEYAVGWTCRDRRRTEGRGCDASPLPTLTPRPGSKAGRHVTSSFLSTCPVLCTLRPLPGDRLIHGLIPEVTYLPCQSHRLLPLTCAVLPASQSTISSCRETLPGSSTMLEVLCTPSRTAENSPLCSTTGTLDTRRFCSRVSEAGAVFT